MTLKIAAKCRFLQDWKFALCGFSRLMTATIGEVTHDYCWHTALQDSMNKPQGEASASMRMRVCRLAHICVWSQRNGVMGYRP